MPSHRLHWAASMVVLAGIVPPLTGAIGSSPTGRATPPDSVSATSSEDSANVGWGTLNRPVLLFGSSGAARDSTHFDVAAALAELRRSVAGRENARSDSVWKNIKVLKQMPAGRLLNVMEQGYSKSLGVNCLHCHVAGEWDSDKKRPKQVARDMMAMTSRINDELLKGIPNLQSEKPTINCTTCHRGQVKPALNLEAAGAKLGG